MICSFELPDSYLGDFYEGDTSLYSIKKYSNDPAIIAFMFSLLSPYFKSVFAQDVSQSTVIATGSATARTLAARFGQVGNVLDFGAKCDGATDDSAAINAALAAKGVVIIPAAACLAAATIHVPPGGNLVGSAFAPQEQASGDSTKRSNGSTILCGVGVDPCVNLDVNYSDSTAVGGQQIRNVDITSAASSPDQIVGTCLRDPSFKTTIQEVKCDGFKNGFYFYGYGGYGLTANLDRVWTSDISGSHIVVDGFAELHVNMARLGANATWRGIIPAVDSYVLFTRTASNSPPGPNTFYIANSQFNGQPNPSCMFKWASLAPAGAGSFVGEYHVVGNHAEWSNSPPAAGIFCSDATVATIQQMTFSDNVIFDTNGSSVVWNLSPDTSLQGWVENGNVWQGFGANGWTLNVGQEGSASVYNFSSTGETFLNPKVSIIGNGQPWTMVVDGANFANGLAISGSFGGGRPRFGGVIQPNTGGVMTNAATTPVEVDIPGYSWTCPNTAGISFGGSPATVSQSSLCWKLNGSIIDAHVYVQLNGVGSGAGAASFTGLPFGAASGNNAVSAIMCENMNGVAAGVFGLAAAGTTTANLYTNSQAGYTPLTASNFTASSVCNGTLSYSIQ